MKLQIDKNLSPQVIQEKHKVSRTTAWRAKKQGYIVKKSPAKISPHFNAEEAYKLAWAIYFRVFHYQYQKARAVQEDIVQEIILALYLKSGYDNYENGGWRWMVGLNAGRDFLYRERIIQKRGGRNVGIKRNQ